MKHTLINDDCFKAMPKLGRFHCVFADPPDNIGREYAGVDDDMPDDEYDVFVHDLIAWSTAKAPIVWISFNSRHILKFAVHIDAFLSINKSWSFQPMVQTFTFGMYMRQKMANNHRPLWLLHHNQVAFYPDNILVPSWRQENGDPRAAPEGRVPGDVFEFPRVVGNSVQKRKWHDNQLHEGLVERCILFSTKPGDTVLDPFAGTGTTLRVCNKHGRSCTTIERSRLYCNGIAAENLLQITSDGQDSE